MKIFHALKKLLKPKKQQNDIAAAISEGIMDTMKEMGYSNEADTSATVKTKTPNWNNLRV